MREISPRRQTEPVPGHYLLRLCPGGWHVPCIVFEHRGCYSCEVDGKLIPGSWTADELENFWPPINSAEDNQVLRISLYGEKCQDASQYRVAPCDEGLGSPKQSASPIASPRQADRDSAVTSGGILNGRAPSPTSRSPSLGPNRRPVSKSIGATMSRLK